MGGRSGGVVIGRVVIGRGRSVGGEAVAVLGS
jgi:hypothetical protein